MPTMLEQAISHIGAGEIDRARSLLIEFLKQNPRDESAWLWMTRCVLEPEQKRYCFEKVLKLNPQNQNAIEGLTRLNSPKPVSPPMPPKVSEQPPIPNRRLERLGTALLKLVIFGVAAFLVLLFLYAW